ncbi:hypothetical protein ASZ90_018455 [hydrocarbon metagenome]|uniref:Uncharacterized protein n=1 Tax=hydrocarbon metagenome TaxID=938273 RepID=A0A0W8E6F4_9ZZZZ
MIRAKHKQDLLGHNTVMMEWSYAINCNIDRQPMGDKYLVFFEYRVLQY